jgi:protein kinase-like protein
MAEFPPGTQFGPYRIARPLGVGGMGAVYAALGPNGAELALKVLSPGGSAEDMARFEREAEAHARVDAHPAVARVHSAGVLHGRAYLTMDLLVGGDLEGRLRRGPLPPEEVRALGLALAGGLAHIHAQGVLHRDIKPANVLFDEQGRPRLTDFGIARPVEASSLTQSGVLLGTPGFMAPEQTGVGRPSAASDVFGLGATLYAALTGQAPFVGRTSLEALTRLMTEAPPPLPPSVPRDLRAAIEGALEKEATNRVPSAAAFAEALQPRAPSSGGGAKGVLLAAGLALTGVLVAGAALSLLPAPQETPLPSGTPPTAPSAQASQKPKVEWACSKPVRVAPEGVAPANRTTGVVTAWLDDRTFVTLADGGVYRVWRPNAQGLPEIALRHQLPAEALGVAFPLAIFSDGFLLWGSDGSPLRFLQLDEEGRPLGDPKLAPLVPHRLVPLTGGRYLIANSKRIAVWRPSAPEPLWSASLSGPQGTPILSSLFVIEERGQVEAGGALEALVVWSPREDESLALRSARLERLRCQGVTATSLWKKTSAGRLRQFLHWKEGVIYGDNIGQVFEADFELSRRVPLALRGSQSLGPIRRVHQGPIRGIALGPEGTLITLGSELPELCVWNPKTGQQLLRYDLSAYLKRGTALRASPNRRCALVKGRDRLVLVSLTPPK